MSVYQKIFAATSRRAAASSAFTVRQVASKSPQAMWLVPGGIAGTWFIFGALTDEIKQGMGLYWDPMADINRVSMERAARLEAKEAVRAAKEAAKGGGDDDEEEENDDEEDEDVSAAVSAAVASALTDDDDDEEDEDGGGDDEEASGGSDEGDDEEEDDEAPKAPKQKKKRLEDMTLEERWDDFLDKSIKPGEDDDDDDDDDDDEDDDDDDDDDE